MPQPLVSIVTSVFNQAEYLEATMLSVLHQDYAALEYIVIDDGSTDDSLVVARQVADRFPGRVTVLTQANAGQASSLNRGWAVSQGSILAYLSSDDCLSPQAVTCMVRALNARPDVVVVYCDFELIDNRGTPIRTVRTEDFDLRRLCVDLVCQPGPGAFFRRSAFEATGGWRAELRQVPDFEFWLRAAGRGHFLRVAEPLAQYRIHDRSASFRAMPVACAEEICGVMRDHWRTRPGGEADLAMAKSLCIAAKNHAQAGRPLRGAARLMQAFRLAPRLMASAQSWRPFLFGLAFRCFGIVSVVRRFRRAQG
ncbi:glycosyltransferase [Roseateles sp.]|uniref:glycosyltransferase n=1 Tax=Roseateles sp. TaxID=1971397 RepID=UPI0025D1BDD7|nr:glycosyltransferase [Roseateles sp.]MBV8033825.1 glycosyltransferase [Roseateles sp.]